MGGASFVKMPTTRPTTQNNIAVPRAIQAARCPNRRLMRAITRIRAKKKTAFALGFVSAIFVNCCAVNMPIKISIDKYVGAYTSAFITILSVVF